MIKTQLERNMMDLVFKAKLLLESRHLEEKELKWSYASVYKNTEAEMPVVLHVLNVEYPLGYIIASYASKIVKVLDEHLSSLITYTINEGEL